MPKTPIGFSEYEDLSIESDINSLKEFLDEKDSWQDPTEYTVIEYFPRKNDNTYSPTTYKVINLRITDIEDGIIFFDGYLDDEDIMLFDNMIENDKSYNLNVLLADDIVMIGIHRNKIVISLDNGYIQILF